METFPLDPLEDDLAYSQAMDILDRLFLLKRDQTQDESDYFRALAHLVHEYECAKVENLKAQSVHPEEVATCCTFGAG